MKKTSIITILAVMALLAVVVGTLVAGTYARYATTQNATATLSTAAWSFSAGFGTEKTTAINLYNTIADATTKYPNLAENHIAPGTSGTFNVVIDATGSEVGVDYTITFAMAEGSAIPSGLSIAVDGTNMTKSNGTFSKTGTIELSKVSTVVTLPVTWSWTYGDQTGEENYDTNATKGANNDDANKDYTLNVTIKGEQHIGA